MKNKGRLISVAAPPFLIRKPLIHTVEEKYFQYTENEFEGKTQPHRKYTTTTASPVFLHIRKPSIRILLFTYIYKDYPSIPI
jgi:hypothetical protein